MSFTVLISNTCKQSTVTFQAVFALIEIEAVDKNTQHVAAVVTAEHDLGNVGHVIRRN